MGSWDEEGMLGIGGSITVLLFVLSEDDAFLCITRCELFGAFLLSSGDGGGPATMGEQLSDRNTCLALDLFPLNEVF